MSNYLNTVKNHPLSGVFKNQSAIDAAARGIDGQRILTQMTMTLRLWMTRSRQRRPLAGLPAYLLEDIDLTPEQAALEAAKPFWVE